MREQALTVSPMRVGQLVRELSLWKASRVVCGLDVRLLSEAIDCLEVARSLVASADVAMMVERGARCTE